MVALSHPWSKLPIAAATATSTAPLISALQIVITQTLIIDPQQQHLPAQPTHNA